MEKSGVKSWLIGTILLVANLWTAAAMANQSIGDIQPDEAMDRKLIDQGHGLGFFNDTSFLVVPIPVSNPTIGNGGALAAAMFFKTDETSKSSVIGTGAFYTDNGSWGAGLLSDIAFSSDKYHGKASAGYANIIYDFYGIGNASAESGKHVSLTQSGYLYDVSLQRRIADNLYVGQQFRFMKIRTAFNLPDTAGEILNNGGPLSHTDNDVFMLGLSANYDTTDKDYAPTRGVVLDGAVDAAMQNYAQTNSFVRVKLNANRFDELMDDLVLASHGSLCAENGKVPIFDLCMFGAKNDLRGYAVGRYQDQNMFAVQEELRWHAFWRIGFVAFAGFGSVAPSVGKFEKILYSGGVGARFLASKEYGVNVGIDGAVNAQGEATYYIQVGEAF